jgi:GPH family glycoside/pentoside/hexuronide:cation symporter
MENKKEIAHATASIELPSTTTARKILYATPRFGIQLFMGMVDFGLLFLYKEVYLLTPILVGLALTLGKISIAAAQFLVSWLSDHTYTRWGRRKPYLIILTPILAISFLLLLLPGLVLGSNPNELVLFGWFAGFNMIAQASYAVTSVYHSWTAEQFPVHERPKVSQYQNFFNFLGLGIIIVFSFLVLTDSKAQLQADPTDIPPIFLTTNIIFAILMIGFLYFCAFYMPIEKTPQYKTEYKKELSLLIHDKDYMRVVFVHGFSSLGWSMAGGIMLGYVNGVIMLSGMNLNIAAGILLIGLMTTLEFWRRSIERRGKKKTLLMVFGFAFCTLPMSVLGYFPWAVSLIFGALIAFCLAASQAGWGLFPYILYADLAQNFEKRHGELKAGLFTGFSSIILNLFQAGANLILGMLLELPNIENVPGNSFTLGYLLWGPFCGLVFFLTFLYVKKNITIDFSWEKDQK